MCPTIARCITDDLWDGGFDLSVESARGSVHGASQVHGHEVAGETEVMTLAAFTKAMERQVRRGWGRGGW